MCTTTPILKYFFEKENNLAKSSLSSLSGLYKKPLLTTHQSLVMMGRENLSLRCSSAHGSFDRFSLVKEGNASLTQHQHGEHWVVFKLGPVDLSFARNYRCYVWHSSNPYVWSAPSDTLELIMAGTYNSAQSCVLCQGRT
jgi:hypothetical protein